ncbi:MAG TPA: 3-hydroxyacyl-CoA dehydrogenase NAD-binding domain-containing protein [Sphingobium sp.]|uniref:3-hydroxyacyl-CoA dehydrogenase NAD-binding domain-containing protein n=1 Tax=Sphingobium sp. TaxID=1912891 RepID=UPI002ED63D64
MRNFKIDLGEDGIALVAFDVPGRSMNTLSDSVIADLPLLIARIRDDSAIRGVVIYSCKDTGFCAGADLGDLGRRVGTPIAPNPTPDVFRQMETCGKPIACALEGVALGGGLEFALGCHYRVAADSPKVKLGVPEVTVGLMPGAGGTQRLPRLIGVAKALPLLLEGHPVGAREALDLHIVDAIVAPGETLQAARRWAAECTDPTAPWDRKGYALPGGLPYSPAGMQTFTLANAMLHKRTYGNFPGPENVLKAVYEGVQVPMDAALRIEANYFALTFATPQARAMVHSMFLARQALAKGGEWAGKAKPPTRVAVIGAGMMGAGIAYTQAARGMETVLIDVDLAAAEKGKAHARGLVNKRVAKRRMTQVAADQLLDRITPATDYAAIGDAELVIEAVFENLDLKREVIRRIEAAAPSALVGSNTSTLPITSLSEASARPQDVVGIHFFSPVDRMELVEVIRGDSTSDEAVARAVAYAVALGKLPIVVNDSRGSFTSRCFGTYLHEGMEMLAEGVPPALIENAGRMTGMPRGPLEIADDVALDLALSVEEQTQAMLGDAYVAGPSAGLLRALVSAGRLGRKSAAGFYDYPEGGSKMLWPGLRTLPGVAADAIHPDVEECKRRLLYRQAVEAARCFDQGVVTDPRSADVGAILATGFPSWAGGPLRYIDMLGAARFVAECDAFVELFGPRFAPPPGLRHMAAEGRSYHAPAEPAEPRAIKVA